MAAIAMLQLNFVEAVRDAGTSVGQGGKKRSRSMETYEKQKNCYQLSGP